MGSFNIHPDFQNEFSYATSPLDPEEFRRQGHMVIDYLADYYQNIEKYPVRSQVEPNHLKSHLPDSAPYNPEPIENILRDLQKHIIPGLTHWQSPSHFALFPCATSTAGFLGEVLSTGFNVVGFNWISSPAATELENIVMDWFGKLLKLPGSFLFSGGGGGVLQGTTCEAMLSTLAAARDQMLRKIGRNNIGKLVVYLSDQTHFSFQKAAQIAGINPSNFRVISTTKDDEFSLCPNSVRSAIIADVEGGLVPLYLCATVGTTLSTAVDPLGPICNIAEEYDMWVHVDAAYAGSACICPEFRHFLDGVEGANSFSLNAHKWFFSSLDCCCLWVKDPSALIKALSTKPEILRNQATDSKQVVDYKDWQISLSRRFRALKLWLVLRSYGVVNLQKFIRGHVNMAEHFEQLVAMNKRFEIVVPRKFSLVCFRISPSAMNQNCKILSTEEDVNLINQKLVESLNASGHVYMTHGVIGGIYFIRFAIGGPLTDYRHVDMAWTLIKDHADALLKAF
ncbi:tyrosine decarboxylase 1-like [Coffea eugenioides]|uniref:tyrosine decarboxylase 1-like n=1 Tax=Coffea eugenioides TaxID=49369 RepID=UPI000F5C7CF5|nr:tyrosine decarboxylase 1-like [Coffea arabica]XP_027185751.1 tyrosine decarboxylase 1-like [Coffea eugenioides]